MEDVLFFQDEKGKQVSLKMIDTFDSGDNTYALFVTPLDNADTEEPGVYVMRMTVDEKGEMDFAMPDDDEMEKIMPDIMARMEESEGYSCDDQGCGGGCHSCGGGCGGEKE